MARIIYRKVNQSGGELGAAAKTYANILIFTNWYIEMDTLVLAEQMREQGWNVTFIHAFPNGTQDGEQLWEVDLSILAKTNTEAERKRINDAVQNYFAQWATFVSISTVMRNYQINEQPQTAATATTATTAKPSAAKSPSSSNSNGSAQPPQPETIGFFDKLAAEFNVTKSTAIAGTLLLAAFLAKRSI